MKEIDLVPLLDASLFPNAVDDEMDRAEVNTHYQGDIFYLDWGDTDDEYLFSNTKVWLVETYGEEIKKYRRFAINPT